MDSWVLVSTELQKQYRERANCRISQATKCFSAFSSSSKLASKPLFRLSSFQSNTSRLLAIYFFNGFLFERKMYEQVQEEEHEG